MADAQGRTTETPRSEKYLTFLLGTQRFAMPISEVREVIRFSAVTEVPLMPDFLLGVINVRGEVLPLMDLSLRLGLEATVFSRRSCVVIVDIAEEGQTVSVGALVDVVQAVLDLDACHFLPPDAQVQRIPPTFLRGRCGDGLTALTVLEPANVFAPAELMDLLGRAGFTRSLVASHLHTEV